MAQISNGRKFNEDQSAMLQCRAMVRKTFNDLRRRTHLSEDQRLQLIQASNLSPSLRNTLASFVNVAGKQLSSPTDQGDEDEWIRVLGPSPWPSWWGFDYWPSVEAVSIEAGISCRTVFHHINKLLDMGILVHIHDGNSWASLPVTSFRHSATYRFNPRVLSPRTMILEWPGSRKSEQSKENSL